MTRLLFIALLTGCSRRSEAPPTPSGSRPPPPSTAPASAAAAPSIDTAVDAGFDATAWVLADTARRAFVLYVPTPYDVIDKMLDVAHIQRDDVLYDVGCGDGRIPIKAAMEYGIKATCIDIDPDRVAEARVNAHNAGVESLVTVKEANAFDVDLTPATVVALYMSSRILGKLVPQLCRLAPGARIVTHDYDIPGLEADGHWTVKSAFFGRRNELFEAGVPEDDAHYQRTEHHVFLWRTPLKGCP
ncbi:MAG: class I SAM-dependent methyltransferase [Polyangiaceae bacterium]